MRSLIDDCGITQEDFERLFEEAGSVTALAKKLGFTRRTVIKYVHKFGLHTIAHKHPDKISISYRPDYSKVALFIKSGRKLPNDLSEAAQLVGISVSDLKNYLNRRRKKVLKYLEHLPKLNETIESLEDDRGRVVPMKLVREILYAFDPRSYIVTIRMYIRSDYCLSRSMSLRNLLEMYHRGSSRPSAAPLSQRSELSKALALPSLSPPPPDTPES